jgi:hypothetical protein
MLTVATNTPAEPLPNYFVCTQAVASLNQPGDQYNNILIENSGITFNTELFLRRACFIALEADRLKLAKHLTNSILHNIYTLPWATALRSKLSSVPFQSASTSCSLAPDHLTIIIYPTTSDVPYEVRDRQVRLISN